MIIKSNFSFIIWTFLIIQCNALKLNEAKLDTSAKKRVNQWLPYSEMVKLRKKKEEEEEAEAAAASATATAQANINLNINTNN
ncbi:hypothetical protein Glove_212g108 [Diversispora epigaea]|uniref:Uncharacterized protein n=1 Tax=Diversispora epigaea TaxID=1348612 RepID=A0A397IRI2_9GLOM|nr:hypothetical protein Glove_212g108 [Diversispora epigaea]